MDRSLKVAAVCPPSSAGFLMPVMEVAHKLGHHVRIFHDTPESMGAADDWGDVVWCEWARQNAVFMSKAGTKPLIVRMLGYDVFEPEFQDIEWPRVDCVVYGCPAHLMSAAEIEPRMKLARRTIQSFTPMDVNAWKFRPRDGTGTKIGMVGQKDARKNLWGALQVLMYLPKVYTLHVAGECEDKRLRAALSHWIASVGLSGRVFFDGYISNLNEWWQDKEFCIVPSIDDQGPRSAFEAMACGAITLAADFPGASSRFDMVWRCPEKLAAGMTAFFGASELSAHASHRSRLLASERFDPKRITTEIKSIIEGAVYA